MEKPLKEIKDEVKDVKLVCMDCKEEFVFSAGEQLYYMSKKLAEPKRCEKCRKVRKDSIVPTR